MNQLKTLIVLLLLAPTTALAVDRYVEDYTDYEEGDDVGRTLRYILKYACDESGDDVIMFAPTTENNVEVVLKRSLVIPEDCNGSVTIQGLEDKDTVINAKNLIDGGIQAGDACSITVYGFGHTIENLSLVHHETGAGICLFGSDNTVKNNRLGATLAATNAPNKYGIVLSDAFSSQDETLSGDKNQLANNIISNNAVSGIWLETDNNVIAANTITYNVGPGIYVDKGAKDNVIGGDSFDDDANGIQFNESGIVLENDETIKKIKITHNLISQNATGSLGVDLGDDGLTLNDNVDTDKGPNKLVNSLDHFQIFSLPVGSATQYYAWGVAASANTVELYFAADEDLENDSFYAGGEEFIKDILFGDDSTGNIPTTAIKPTAGALLSVSPLADFEILPTDDVLSTDRAITALVIDAHGNTSEYAAATLVATDTDSDGIIDSLETNTDTTNPDSDDDGLADGVEDKNHNGTWDEDLNETDATLADTDGDRVSDWAETHADGVFDGKTDTNPLVADTDGDGVRDGREDKNHNGVIEIYLGETNPLVSDSDGDSVNDGEDTCPSVYNPNQEEWFCDTASGIRIQNSGKPFVF